MRRNNIRDKKQVRTLDSFKPQPEKPKVVKKHRLWGDSPKYTLEWFRGLYYDDGFESLIKELEAIGFKQESEQFEPLLRTILYGTMENNIPRERPLAPPPRLRDTNLHLWRFMDKVLRDYEK